MSSTKVLHSQSIESTAGVRCVEYPPASVKQAVCGYGRAEKTQVQQMAKAILGLETTPTPTHAADALALAIWRSGKPPSRRARQQILPLHPIQHRPACRIRSHTQTCHQAKTQQ